MYFMQDDVYRLWKIYCRSKKNLERLSCGLCSKEDNFQLAIKMRRKARKKRHQEDYENANVKVHKRQRVVKAEKSRFKRAKVKYFRARKNLFNFIYEASNIKGDYRDNFTVEFSRKRPQIDIFFGGLDGRPKGRKHGHCGLDPVTLRPKFTTRYPGEPHPINTKKQKFYDRANDESTSIFVYGRALAYAIKD